MTDSDCYQPLRKPRKSKATSRGCTFCFSLYTVLNYNSKFTTLALEVVVIFSFNPNCKCKTEFKTLRMPESQEVVIICTMYLNNVPLQLCQTLEAVIMCKKVFIVCSSPLKSNFRKLSSSVSSPLKSDSWKLSSSVALLLNPTLGSFY